ncbi:MAG: sigma 54-interacting transcriptional regulator, partial [Desulfobacterales bacterium]
SELFGHKKGAFTGAQEGRTGAIRHADGGTVFLDEIDKISPDTQGKLLRVIEYKEIKPLGIEESITVDIRFVFATNKNLKDLVHDGKLLDDFFYRIKNHLQPIPPLRERQDDIPLLAEHFRILYNEKLGKQIESFTPDFITKIRNLPWTGNVRELMSVIEHAILYCEGTEITLEDPPETFIEAEEDVKNRPKKERPSAEKFLDHEVIFWMKKLNNNQSEAATKLGVDRLSIRRRLEKLGRLPKR